MALTARTAWMCGGLLAAALLSAWLALLAHKLPRDPVVFLEAVQAWPAFRDRWLILTAVTVGAVVLMWLHSLRERMFGDARFANASEIAAASLSADVGIVLGRSPFGGYLIADRPGHVIVEAPPRSGKTTGMVIPTLLQFPGSCIVIDLKGELYETTSGYRASIGDVFVFDPSNEDWRTHRVNPLDGVGTARDEAQRYDEVERMAHVLVQTPKGADPHWSTNARQLFKGIVLHLAHDGSPVCCSEVLDFARSGVEPLQAKILRMAKAGDLRNVKAAALLTEFAVKPEKEAGSIASTLSTSLAIFDNPRVAAATATSDFGFEDLRRRRSTIYLICQYADMARFGSLFFAIYVRVMAVLSRRMPGADETLDVLLMLDEFANFGRMDYLFSAAAALAGYRIRVFVIVQSGHQVEMVYSPAERKALYDLCKFRAVYQPNSLESSEEISKLLGTKTVVVRNRSYSRGASNVSVVEQSRALMLPQEVRRLGDDAVLVFPEGARPVKGRKSRYFEDKKMKARIKPPAPLPAPISAAVIAVQSFVDEFVAKSTFIERLGASSRDDAELGRL
jgi:type IV secretion system protein VirD4